MIDHLVLPVTTLTLARSRLTGLGFTVAPDARHPFGTGNCCVLFENRSYLEPIAIVDRNAADQAAADGQFFVKRVRRFMERRGEGFAMVALRSDDAEADAERFAAAGLSAGPVFRFSRRAAQADGGDDEIGVALAYADDPLLGDATIFACQHRSPDLLFETEWLRHQNGATGVGRVTAVAESPGDFGALISSISGVAISKRDDGVEVVGGTHRIGVVTPAAFLDRYGVAAPDPRQGLLFAAVEIRVADLERAVGYAGPTAARRAELIIIPSAPGFGCVLAFRGQDDD